MYIKPKLIAADQLIYLAFVLNLIYVVVLNDRHVAILGTLTWIVTSIFYIKSTKYYL